MIRELTIGELDIVSGGADPNYKFCWNGPAGEGTYPNYVDCGENGPHPFDNFRKAAQQCIQQAQHGGRPA
jgi:hypothetical protein